MTGTAAHRPRVLVVDDQEDCRSTLAELLSMHGCEVKAAADGRTAIAIAKAFHPTVVFLDLGMPVMNGYEVALTLRSDPQTKSTFIVATTGYGMDHDRHLAAEAGINLHLVKPVALTDLVDAIRAAGE